MSRPVRYPLTIFYDASCPMCATEMRGLKARDVHGRLELVDCSAPEFDEAGLLGDGIRRRDLMDLVHARDAHGRWFVGVDVFRLAYGAAGLQAVSDLCADPRWAPWLKRLYPWIARYRQGLSRLGLNRILRLLLRAPPRQRSEAR